MLRQWVPFWVIPVVLIFAAGTVWLRLALVRTTYAISEINREIDRSRQDRELLQVKFAALRSPKRLEILARTHFGLGQPRMEQVIHFKSNISSREPVESHL